MIEKNHIDYIRNSMNPLFAKVINDIFREVELEAAQREDYKTAAHYRDLQNAEGFRVRWDEEGVAETIQIIQTEETCK